MQKTNVYDKQSTTKKKLTGWCSLCEPLIETGLVLNILQVILRAYQFFTIYHKNRNYKSLNKPKQKASTQI